ncbi:hypothetical protein [Mycolicibacterium thermoresistibile]
MAFSISSELRRADWARYLRAGLAGAAVMVLIAVPTDILNTPWFTREIPVRWWEYPTLAAIGVLTAMWVGIRPRTGGPGGSGAAGGIALAAFAVGCPVCNKLILAAIGTTGALGIWAPMQPILAVMSVALMAGLVWWRWRQQPCASGECEPAPAGVR